MMKLNRKGYMLVEIVVASVLAMGIAYYLLNLTYRFKDLDEDVYQSYLYVQDKNLIVKNVMNDLEKRSIVEVGEVKRDENNYQYVDFKDSDNKFIRVKLVKEDEGTTFYYGEIDTGVEAINEIPQDVAYKTAEISYYQRTFEQILTVGDMAIDKSASVVTFKIPISSVYDDKDYSVKFFCSYGSSLDEVSSGSGDSEIPINLSLIDYNDTVSIGLGLNINGSLQRVDCQGLSCGSFQVGTEISIEAVYVDGSDVDIPTDKLLSFNLETSKTLKLTFYQYSITDIKYE